MSENPKFRDLRKAEVVGHGLTLVWACQQVRSHPGAPVVGGGDPGVQMRRDHWDERENVYCTQRQAFDFRDRVEQAADIDPRLMSEERARELMRELGIG